MNDSYKDCFTSESAATIYETNLLGAKYFSILWDIEKKFLSGFLDRYPMPERLSYLDFACGTGRIISHLEPRVGEARGIEISEAMLQLAETKVTKADLVCADITDTSVPIEGQYDLITAFRFFLNAEPPLRVSIMNALSARLKDENSRLVFNVHAHLPSHKSLVWMADRVVKSYTGRKWNKNFLSRSTVIELLKEAGLELQESYGYDMLSGKTLKLIPYNKVKRFEESLAGSQLANMLGGHQIYVARPHSRP